MIDPEKMQITLTVAGNKIRTTIPRREEARLRAVEREVNDLMREWLLRNPQKTESEVLSMVAFQYAKMYYDILAENNSREKKLTDFVERFEGELDKILLKV